MARCRHAPWKLLNVLQVLVIATTLTLGLQPPNKMAMVAAAQASSVVRIACGMNGTISDDMNREWNGDVDLDDVPTSNVHLDLMQASNTVVPTPPTLSYTIADHAPFTASRIFDSEATYTFKHVSPGRFWFLNQDFQRMQDASFSVMLDHNIKILSHISLFNLISHMNPVTGYLMKEFIVHITRNKFDLTFIPSSSYASVAMVSGIELQPLPENVFPTYAKDVRTWKTIRLPADNNYTYETVYRMNVRGKELNDGLGRKWSTGDLDNTYMTSTTGEVEKVNDVSVIFYGTPNPWTAPPSVYASARVLSYKDEAYEHQSNLSWRLPVDGGDAYVVRLHFCELQFGSPNRRVLDVYVNEKIMDGDLDLVNARGRRYVAMVRDYHNDARRMGANGEVYLDLMPSVKAVGFPNVILNGLEVFQGGRTSTDRRRLRLGKL